LKIGRDTTERKRADEQLKQAYDSLEQQIAERTLSLQQTNSALQAEVVERRRAEQGREQVLRRLITVQEDERRRISRELHDQLGQQLTALSLQLSSLEALLESKEVARGRVQYAQGIVDTVSRDISQLAFLLRPTSLDDLGLEAALQNYIAEWSRQTGMRVDLQSDLHGLRLAPNLATTAYRVIQEALTNVVKHASASQISLIVERRKGELILIVEDNGVGFDVEATQAAEVQNRLGLLGMEERVSLMGGSLLIEASEGQGTTVIVRLPLAVVDEERDDE